MKKVMQKVSQWWSNLSNASKIRANYHKFFTVKNQLITINIAIALYVLAALSGWLEATKVAQAAGVACGCFAAWLCGLRLAIAKSLDAKQGYMRKTKQVIRKLSILVIVVAAVVFTLVYTAVILASAIKMGYFTKLVEIYPVLETLSSSITMQVNEMLEKLIPFVG